MRKKTSVAAICAYLTSLDFCLPQLSQQPDRRPSTTPSRVGRSPAARCATEPSTTHTHGRPTQTVHITRLTHTPCSPTGWGTGARTQSWAPSPKEARPPRRPPQRDRNTPKSCSPTPPSPLRAARGARAAPRATAPRFPPRRRTVRHRTGWAEAGRGGQSDIYVWKEWTSVNNFLIPFLSFT